MILCVHPDSQDTNVTTVEKTRRTFLYESSLFKNLRCVPRFKQLRVNNLGNRFSPDALGLKAAHSKATNEVSEGLMSG